MAASDLLVIEPLGGLSGDMFLGALLDLGLPPADLRRALAKIGLETCFTMTSKGCSRHGIAAVKVDFPAIGGAPPAPRDLPGVEKMLAGSALPAEVLAFSRAVFHNLAAAEAKVHNSTPARVHFHEVGEYDTLADIVGFAAGLAHFKPRAVKLRPVPLGTGFVDCAHGRLPVPVPAVVELLQGLPVYDSGIEAELVTPTGAAILKTLMQRLPVVADGQVISAPRFAYGAGSRDLKARPNLLRLGLSRFSEIGIPAREDCVVLEAVIDDMTAERIAFLSENLRSAGALEVLSWPAAMKKGRLGTVIQIIAHPEQESRLVDIFFRDSSSLGLRRHLQPRYVLERENVTLTTSLGQVACKVARTPAGPVVNYKFEHEDLAAMARAGQLSLQELERKLLAELPPLENIKENGKD